MHGFLKSLLGLLSMQSIFQRSAAFSNDFARSLVTATSLYIWVPLCSHEPPWKSLILKGSVAKSSSLYKYKNLYCPERPRVKPLIEIPGRAEAFSLSTQAWSLLLLIVIGVPLMASKTRTKSPCWGFICGPNQESFYRSTLPITALRFLRRSIQSKPPPSDPIESPE